MISVSNRPQNHSNVTSCSDESHTKTSNLNPEKLSQTNTDDSSFSSANQPAYKQLVLIQLTLDKCIKPATNHSDVTSCSDESHTKTSNLNPEKLSQTNTDDSGFSPANQPAYKQLVLIQPTLDNNRKAVDIKYPSAGQTPTKQSSPRLSPHIVHTVKTCDNACNTHTGILSKQSPQLTCAYKQNAKQLGYIQCHKSDNNQHQSNCGDQKSAEPLQIPDSCTSESDSDFIDTKPKVSNPPKSHKQKQIHLRTSPKRWEELNSSLQSLLPNIDDVTYVVESHEDRQQPSFEGAPKFN